MPRTAQRAGFKAVFGHAGYLINLGGPPSPDRARSLQSLIQEISFAGALGLPFLVLHPGAHLGAGEERGLELIVAGLDEALAKTKKSGVRLALENTAGQGTCLGHKIEHLAANLDAVQQPARLGLCLDTAHFFAAGFDLRTGKGWDAAIAKVEKLIGRKEILAFHLNDSKTGLGSRVIVTSTSAGAKLAWPVFATSSTTRAFCRPPAAWKRRNRTTCTKHGKPGDFEGLGEIAGGKRLVTRKTGMR